MAVNNEVIHQHTVPICYLANFGIRGNQGRKTVLFFFNKQNGKTGQSGVEVFPVEKHFYDFEDAGEKKQTVEKFFAVIEGELSTLLKTTLGLVIIDPQQRKFSAVQFRSKEKNTLSSHIALLKIRTRAFRDYYKSVYQQIKNGFPFVAIPQYEEPDFKRLHTTVIRDFKMSNFYTNLFDDRTWIFLVNHTDTPFVSSDNPVITIDNRRIINGPISPVSKEATIYFPISPAVAIEMYDKTVPRTDLSYFDIYQNRHVSWYNRQMLEKCTRFLFSNKTLDTVINEVME